MRTIMRGMKYFNRPFSVDEQAFDFEIRLTASELPVRGLKSSEKFWPVVTNSLMF